MASSSAGRSPPQAPQLNKFRISRRGRKLQISDDQRTLLSLPKDVPERTWAEILQKDENDLICFDIREEILEEAMHIGYERYMERQNALFTAHCAAQAWLKLIDWHFYRHDPGEEPSAYPPCFIPKRVESWTPDELPYPSAKDTWGKQELEVVDGAAPEEEFSKWPSSESLKYPVVEDIPAQYWFPGKVILESVSKEDSEELDEVTLDGERQRKKSQKKRPGAVSSMWDYADDSYGSESLLEEVAAESEVLQKITDYSKEEFSKASTSPSAVKPSTPADGSLQGAGDSAVDVGPARPKRPSLRRFDKSKSGFSRASLNARSRQLAPLKDGSSGSRISAISDCRLRNLRVDTQYEISSEKVTTPLEEVAKRKM